MNVCSAATLRYCRAAQITALSLLCLLLGSAACGTKDKIAAVVTCPQPGNAVAGALDAHCTAAAAQATSDAACYSAATQGSSSVDSMGTDFGATMFNAEGDDDDCKYHVKWSSTPICKAGGTVFTANVTKLVGGAAVAGANTRLEVFLNDTHPAPNSNQQTKEIAPGSYEIGPINFDAVGQWTIRFHFFETCVDDDPASPHAHAAFFVNVI